MPFRLREEGWKGNVAGLAFDALWLGAGRDEWTVGQAAFVFASSDCLTAAPCDARSSRRPRGLC